ncbi:hypothetical protein D9M68_756510 [compost metagenome]
MIRARGAGRTGRASDQATPKREPALAAGFFMENPPVHHSRPGIAPRSTVGCAARTDPGYQPNSVPSRYTVGSHSTPYRETPRSTVGCAARTDPGCQPNSEPSRYSAGAHSTPGNAAPCRDCGVDLASPTGRAGLGTSANPDGSTGQSGKVGDDAVHAEVGESAHQCRLVDGPYRHVQPFLLRL